MKLRGSALASLCAPAARSAPSRGVHHVAKRPRARLTVPRRPRRSYAERVGRWRYCSQSEWTRPLADSITTRS